ncbi:glycosyl transferase [Microcella sp.]|uniref:glycosyl transferase n=1 Tax=Microcella sp. TaxID=1913979 RepID=UPI00256A0FBF|nr:glycosyl transferase [Microcella sp.]MBX9472726.1 glycosyl transferase [Microcella sp.]
MSAPRTDPAAAPHVLYVAWGYPPSRSAGMYRALATANAFARDGWRVTVLTTTRETFERLTGSDPQSEASIDPRVSVVRIPFDAERSDDNLANWSRLRVYSALLWTALRWIPAWFSFPERSYGGWKKPLITAADAIHREHPVDLVVGSANPNVDFAVGWHLHRRHGVPYVMDHRDAWHLDVYTGARTAPRLSRSSRLESRMFARSAEAWFVNAPIRDWHAGEHPSKADDFHVVANGFDPEFLQTDRDRAPDAEAGLVFGYLGTIYGPIPLRETLDAWRLARTRSPLLARSRLVVRGRLGHFSEPDPAVAELLDAYRADGVSYEGPVSKTAVSEVYRSFDALLLIISRSPFVTSGKVFEYAASGLPIAALHDPVTAATSVLADHPARFGVEAVGVEQFAHALIATGESAAAQTPESIAATQQWARQFARDEQLRPRIQALRAVTESEAAR